MKSYTSIEQSKKLAEILPLESADMCWCNNSIRGINYTDTYDIHTHTLQELKEAFDEAFNGWDKYWRLIPAWSLAALLGVLPEIQGGKPVISLDDNYITYPHMSDLHTKADNLVDACVAMIEKLNELKML